jgi:L-lactate dehydrogenase complex protein LldG
MQERTSRELMLKRIRQALIHKTDPKFPQVDWESSVYNTGKAETPEERFAEAFTRIGGHFTFCENDVECIENLVRISEAKGWKRFDCNEKPLQRLLKRFEFPYSENDGTYPEGMVGITGCEALVSRLGSVIVSSGIGSGRRLFVAPTYHIVIAHTSQVVPELKDALQLIRNKYGEQIPSMIASLAGPSRTADIEKTLVTPAHGPEEIHVLLVDRPFQ